MSTPSFASTPFAVKNECHRFAGQVAIVTGAAQGLGRVIAHRLGQEGASVVVADIQGERAARTALQLTEEVGGQFMPFAGDLSEVGVADRMAKETHERFGRIDALVNNAAALIRLKLVDMSEELLQKGVQWNVWNTLRCCKAVLPYMLQQKYGRIVNIGGEAWRIGLPFHTLLAGVGKGSMVGLTVTLAGEVLRDGITVNCVSPGGIETEADGDPDPLPPSGFRDPSWNPPEVMKAMAEAAQARTAAGAIGRLAHPSEIASAVAFFAARESSFTTGQHIGVSGGMAML
jgi:NAD(P)-dependent dehydrogenase (short-subunit alcohol dehydrogenase family)